jgi:hypothetical protein
LTSEQAWRLTPAQYAALSNRFFEAREFIDWQMGWLRALIVEPYRDKRRHPNAYKINEFSMFHQDIEVSGEMTPEQQLEYVKNIVLPAFRQIGIK